MAKKLKFYDNTQTVNLQDVQFGCSTVSKVSTPNAQPAPEPAIVTGVEQTDTPASQDVGDVWALIESRYASKPSMEQVLTDFPSLKNLYPKLETRYDWKSPGMKQAFLKQSFIPGSWSDQPMLKYRYKYDDDGTLMADLERAYQAFIDAQKDS